MKIVDANMYSKNPVRDGRSGDGVLLVGIL